jgi:hypothetical protein
MARVPRRQLFTKAIHAESVLKGELVGAAKRSHGVRDPKKVGGVSLAQSTPQVEEGTCAQGRCRQFNPNAYAAPFNRTRTPRSSRNRRPAGWIAVYITLPKITVEGLKRIAITLAEEGQHSPWPKERRRYPRTKSHLVGEALDHYFHKLGFPEFCLQPPQGEGHR